MFLLLIVAILVGVRWCHRGFDVHFPNDIWCRSSFCVVVDHLYILFREMSSQGLSLFLNWGVCLFVVEL